MNAVQKRSTRSGWRLPVLPAALTMTLLVSSGFPVARADDPEDRVVDLLNTAAGGTGTTGVYLRQVGGSTIAANDESFVFEPASTIKALIHFHAMKQVEDDPAVDLTTMIPWFAGPADYNNGPPPGTNAPSSTTMPGSESLSNSLQQMMGPSDNRRTQALRDFFTDAAIDATRIGFGMTNSGLDPDHIIGCGDTAVSDPNRLTLVDAGLMYESVFTGGFLSDPATAAGLMTQDVAAFDAIIDTESAGMGLSAASINQFKALRQSANKAGSYGLSTGQYRTVAGWSTVPWKDGSTCDIVVEDYVYGVFIHAADSITAGFSIRATGVELFREEIRAALESWVACEADLQITSSTVVDPPAEMDVNTPTVLTVRVAMRNNGPADDAAGELTLTTTVPADCEITPTGSVTDVPNMPQGELVVVELDFTVECAQPSFHQFRFDSEIAPAIAAMVDPNQFNNTGVAQTTIAVIARADLAITDWDFSTLDGAGIGDLLVGQDFLFSTTKTLHNFGDTVGDLYHDPVGAVVQKSLVVPEGVRGIVTVGAGEAPATITIERPALPDEVLMNQSAGTTVEVDGPATLNVEFVVSALQISVDRIIDEDFGLHCIAPGEHEVSFHNAIEPQDQHVVDPDSDNNTVDVIRTIECVTPVQINIRPGNSRNHVNPTSRQSLPLAILTTDAGEYDLPIAFDATQVDYASVSFGTEDTLNLGGGSTASPNRDFIRDSFEMDDRTRDGDLDMVLHFHIPESGIGVATEEACVFGSYLGDDNNVYSFFGCDDVTIQGGAVQSLTSESSKLETRAMTVPDLR